MKPVCDGMMTKGSKPTHETSAKHEPLESIAEEIGAGVTPGPEEKMREIKFRGWHSTLKKMFSAEEMASDQLTILPIGQFINVSGDSTLKSVIYPQDKFIPLQYIGRKDKNNKEIYQGDILGGSKPELSVEGEIEWCDESASFTLVIRDSNGELLRRYDLWSNPSYMNHRNPSEFEVVGNIYENSELINN